MNDSKSATVFKELVKCYSNTIYSMLLKYKYDIPVNNLSKFYCGFIVLTTLFCRNTSEFEYNKNDKNGNVIIPFSVENIYQHGELPICPSIKKNNKNEDIFNGSVSQYISGSWKNHISTSLGSMLNELHNCGETLDECQSERISHFFSVLFNKGRNNSSELQDIWVNFYTELLNTIKANELFEKSDNESGKAFISSINHFINSHKEFSDDSVVVDAESFCTHAAEFYLTLFMIAANDYAPRVINLLFLNSIPEEANKQELLDIVCELTELISSPKIDYRAKDIYLSQVYFKWVNNKHTQAVLFESSVIKEDQLNTIINGYTEYSDEYLSRKNKKEEKKIPFREYDLRNQHVISRIVPIILKNENTDNSQLTTEHFCGVRHCKKCYFGITNDPDPNLTSLLSKWFKSFSEKDYSRNPKYYIQMTDEEIRAANERNDMYLIKTNTDKGEEIVGAALMSYYVNTVSKYGTPYNGGKMKKALDSIGIYEGSYACLNTVIIDSKYRGYRLQALMIDLLISLAILHGKSWVVATVADINEYSYRNFIDAGFVDIDYGKNSDECSVIYEVDGQKCPRHLVILDLRKQYKGNTDITISQNFRLEKNHIGRFIEAYWNSEVCHNPQYKYYDGRNCQNFVSEALVAAGMPLSPKFYPEIPDKDKAEEANRTEHAFENVKAFISYMKEDLKIEYLHTQSEAIARAEAFDVLITNDEGHSMIITKVIRNQDSENGDVVICAAGNTNDRNAENVVEHSVICGLLKTSKLFN